MIPAVFELGGPEAPALPSVPWFDGESTLVLAFGAAGDLARAHHAALRTAFPKAVLLGASTSCGFLGERCRTETMVCASLHFERGRVRHARVPLVRPEQSHQAGVELGAQLDQPDLQAVLLFDGGRVLRSASLLRGLGTSLPPGTVVVGGLADGASETGSEESSWVLDEDGLHGASIVAVGLYGASISVRGVVSKGWQRFGPRRRVTRASGPWVYELDERPVVKLYEDYLGASGTDLLRVAPRLPLGLHDPGRGGAISVRSVVGIDDRCIALSFSGEVPQGAEVQLLRARKSALIDGAAHAASRLARGMRDERPRFVLALGHRGRRMVLGLRAPEEIESARAALPEAVPLLGFVSGGALLARVGGEGELYGESFTMLEITEG